MILLYIFMLIVLTSASPDEWAMMSVNAIYKHQLQIRAPPSPDHKKGNPSIPPRQSLSMVNTGPVKPRYGQPELTTASPRRGLPPLPPRPKPGLQKNSMGPPKGVPVMTSTGRHFLHLQRSPQPASSDQMPVKPSAQEVHPSQRKSPEKIPITIPKHPGRVVTTGHSLPLLDPSRLAAQPLSGTRLILTMQNSAPAPIPRLQFGEPSLASVQRKADSSPPILHTANFVSGPLPKKVSPQVSSAPNSAAEGLMKLGEEPEIVSPQRSKRPRFASTKYKNEFQLDPYSDSGASG